MNEDEYTLLKDKHKKLVNQLVTYTCPTNQVPLPTQVEDVKRKTIKFKDNSPNDETSSWTRKAAKRHHKQENYEAVMQMREGRKMLKIDRKRARRKERNEATAVMDSGATSTCIREEDTSEVEVLRTNSNKTFYNANGTLSDATKKARLQYDIRQPANDADVVPDLAMNSLISMSKLADANYITMFTNDEVMVFDAETTKFNI